VHDERIATAPRARNAKRPDQAYLTLTSTLGLLGGGGGGGAGAAGAETDALKLALALNEA
jgi:hypothetical protein